MNEDPKNERWAIMWEAIVVIVALIAVVIIRLT